MERDEVYWLKGTITLLEARVGGLTHELHVRDLRLKEKESRIAELEQQVEELKKRALAEAGPGVRQTPAFIKPNRPRRHGKTPGRKPGHKAALRAMPKRIDHHQQVPLPTDPQKHPVCPHCRCRLTRRRRHRRLVEDLVPSSVEVTCYHTQSGHCPHCRKRIESRAPEQPPAANVPHGQLGINALATGAILRVRHRLPFRQIAQLLKDMPGLNISAGGLVKQLRRLSRWLDGKYQDLIRQMRASEHVHADETGWRIDGGNFWLWAFTDPTFTLFHVDESRGGKVPLKLLGKAFGGTLVSDFYSAYSRMDCGKQKCLTHLMREVKETAEKSPGFAQTPLRKKLLRWCKEALRLKKRWDELDDSQYDKKASGLEDRLDAIMQVESVDSDACRLCRRLRRHRSEMTRFLWDQKLDGTNNAAERALRPAVVMRKITGGSRSREGAQAWATLASLLRTADQRQLGVYDATKKLVLDYWATGRR